MITNENEFLGFLIKNSEETGYVYQYDCLTKGSLSDRETIKYAKSLISKGYITADLSNYYVTDLGKKNYVPKIKSFSLKLFSFSVSSLKSIVKIAAEIAVALIIAYLIYHFGWQ